MSADSSPDLSDSADDGEDLEEVAPVPADPVEVAEAVEIERIARDLRRARGFTTAARRALVLARRYREEEGMPHGAREAACVKQALAWRASAHDLRRRAAIGGPGLARTSSPPSPADRRHAG